MIPNENIKLELKQNVSDRVDDVHTALYDFTHYYNDVNAEILLEASRDLVIALEELLGVVDKGEGD